MELGDKLTIELKDIEIQAGINNQHLGYYEIESSSLRQCPRIIPLTGEGAKYSLIWEPVE